MSLSPPPAAVAVPLPSHLDPLPPLLTFGQVVDLFTFWNVGGRTYARDMRDVGVLVSANAWPHGQRARYAAAEVLKLYPVGGPTEGTEGHGTHECRGGPTEVNRGGLGLTGRARG